MDKNIMRLVKTNTITPRVSLLVFVSAFLISSIGSYISWPKTAEAATPKFTESWSATFPQDEGVPQAQTAIETDANDNIYAATGNITPKIHKYNNNGELQTTITITGCNGGGYNKTVKSLAIASTGEIYALVDNSVWPAVNAYTCIQKYSSNGTYIRDFAIGKGDGSQLTKIAVDSTGGRVFVVNAALSAIIILDLNSGTPLYGIGGTGMEATQFGTPAINAISDITYTNDRLYVNNFANQKVQVFNSETTFINWFDLPSNEVGLADSIEVDAAGIIYLASSYNGLIYTYNDDGSFIRYSELPYKAYSNILDFDIDSQKNLYVMQIGSDRMYSYEYQMINKPVYPVLNLEISDITNDSATVTWEANPNETQPELINQYTVRVTEGNQTSNAMTSGTTTNSYTIMPGFMKSGTDYTVHIAAQNDDGRGPEASISFKTTGEPPVPPVPAITGVNFGMENGRKTLFIEATNLLADLDSEGDVFTRSIMSLNGTALPFCALGTGETAQQMIDAYSGMFPNIANYVSDNPPCYFIISEDGGVGLSSNGAKIWLPSDFDVTAPGTVVFNNNTSYSFNTGNSEEVNITPTIVANGKSPASGLISLPNRPTFSGIATPGARVLVTVHSDPVTCSTTADSEGNWSCTLSSDLPAGQHTLYVNVTNPDNSTAQLGPYNIVVSEQVAANTAKKPQRFVRGNTDKGQIAVLEDIPEDESTNQPTNDNDVSTNPDSTSETEEQTHQKTETKNWTWLWIPSVVIILLVLAIIAAVGKTRRQ